jgi:cytoskeleton protein RodZ
MTSVTNVNESSTRSLPADFETPGAILRTAREKAGLATGDLARQLNLSVTKLEALEQDQYDKLASDVFAQGYLRRYAKLLGVDDDLIVQRFNEYLALSRESEAGSETGQTTAGGALSLPKWILPGAIFVLAILVLAFIYWRTAGSDAKGPVVGPVQEEQAQELAPENQPTPQPEAELEAEPDLQPQAEAVPALPRAEAVVPDEVQQPVAQPRVAEEPTELQPSAAPDRSATAPALAEDVAAGDQDSLAFAFSDECWVEVRDADGAVIYADLATAGETVSVEGEAPFSVMLGNARAASLSYNGELVPVDTQAGKRTARLTVGG